MSNKIAEKTLQLASYLLQLLQSFLRRDLLILSASVNAFKKI